MDPVDCSKLYAEVDMYEAISGNFSDDAPFYAHIMQSIEGDILELACGSGRLMSHFVEMGKKVTGIDVSMHMLEYARKKFAGIKIRGNLICADVRNFCLKKRFNVILFPFNSIAHLHDYRDVASCFQNALNHLTEDGIFVLDIFNPNLGILSRDCTKRFLVCETRHPITKEEVSVTESNLYDDASQINRIRWFFHYKNQAIEKEFALNMRMFFPQELDCLLTSSGFEILLKYGDYNMEVFQSKSPKQLIVARRCR